MSVSQHNQVVSGQLPVLLPPLPYPHLVWSPSRYEHSITQTLYYSVTLHAILLIKPFSQGPVQVPGLVVYGVVVWLKLVPALDGHLVEQIAYFVRVPRVVDVPKSARHLLLLPYTSSGEDVTASLIDGLECLCWGKVC